MSADTIRLRFRIDCATRWGEQVALSGDLDDLGRWAPKRALTMFCMGPGRWDLGLGLPRAAVNAGFSYKYLLLDGGDPVWESGPTRLFDPSLWPAGGRGIELRDDWHASGGPQDFYNTRLFTRVLCPTPHEEPGAHPPGPLQGPAHGFRRVHFRVAAGRIPAHRRLCLVGAPICLGQWRETAALAMDSGPSTWWTLTVDLPIDLNAFEYKYGFWDLEEKRLVAWETGANRRLAFEPPAEDLDTFIRTDEAFGDPRGPFRGAGVAVPLFALRSSSGLGVGEFPDLKLLVDWACRTGLNLIQLLPVNDTSMTGTWRDAYPYRAVSAFALHPIYLRVGALTENLPPDVATALTKRTRTLNAQAAVDYEAVVVLKRRLVGRIYAQERRRLAEDAGYRQFIHRNAFWLKPYAVFCLLRDRFGSADWQTWPPAFQDAAIQIEAMTGADGGHDDALGEIFFIQYHLHRQLSEAVAYARKCGVAFKGDIPIGVSANSADAWRAPAYFQLDRQAGAPPDDFSENGQNWSMPTYNWAAMAADDYRWWLTRIHQMAAYFDAVRIDHILGFFRIWEIPVEMVQGLMGRFNPALPLSAEELADRGVPLHTDPARYCRPYLRRRLMEVRFGRHTDAIIAACCTEIAPGIYTLSPAADSQRKLLRLPLPASVLDAGTADEVAVRRELLRLCTEVLLLPDLERPGYYHPPINLHHSDSFQALETGIRERLWQVYLDFFYRRHEACWRKHGLERLSTICDAADMLVCGEDLGMVPACVPAVMAQLGILSLKVQRMPAQRGVAVDLPDTYPYLSVCTTATHDMASLREWWQSLPEDAERQELYSHILGRQGRAPTKATPDLCAAIVEQHLAAPSMWAIFPLQDLLAMDGRLRHPDPGEERINIPSDPDHCWRYRLHLRLEDLLTAEDFNAHLRDMIARSGRGSC